MRLELLCILYLCVIMTQPKVVQISAKIIFYAQALSSGAHLYDTDANYF